MEPLGTVIATNASWGGLRNVDKGRRPIPKDTVELTDRTIAVTRRVLDYHGVSMQAIPNDVAMLKADDESRRIWKRDPWRINHRTTAVNVGVEYPKSATIAPGQVRRLVTHLENPHPAAIELRVELQGTPALSVADTSRVVALGPKSEVALSWDVAATGPLLTSNRLNLSLSVKQRPALPTLPVILLGASRWRLLGPFPAEGKSDRELFDTVFGPEILTGPLTSATARAGAWREVVAESNGIPFTEPFTQAGNVYAQAFTWSPVARAVRIGVPGNTPVKIWLNGKLVNENFIYRPVRPNFDGQYDNQPIPYLNTELQSGWNEIFLKFVRGDAPLLPPTATFEAELLLCDPTELNAGLTDQVRTRFPWE